MESLVINLFAGPGTGKSTTAAGLFHRLKSSNTNCEMALEYAKDKVWEGSIDLLSNQIYVFGKQQHRIHRLLGKVSVIITDSPLLLSIHYGKGQSNTFRDLVLEQHHSMKNFNVFLLRNKPYNPSGRLQSENEARKMDEDIETLLLTYGIPYSKYNASSQTVISDILMEVSGRGLIDR